MNTKSAMVASVAASLVLGIADAFAAPYVANIEGTTALYFDYDGFDFLPEQARQPFLGQVTFDVASSPIVALIGPEAVLFKSSRACAGVLTGS